ncbi:flavodoxin domain-containing protein [Kocuria sp. NPDC057446]|uniref:flavodoxin domain-containing protein n=1 Tax=Kocuria sp. NPDC057446 TaxID=3346137 RepID=UPI0036A5CED9
MTVLVVYESVYGNTHRIAEAIGRGLAEAGVPAQVRSTAEAERHPPAAGDVLVVGAPTHGHGLSRENSREQAVRDASRHDLEVDDAAAGPGVREWLAALGAEGGRATAFDTRVKGPAMLTGRASQKIARALEEHHYELVAQPESFLVTMGNDLVPGEEDRARRWGRDLAAAL